MANGDNGGGTQIDITNGVLPGGTTLLAAPPPPAASEDLTPEQIEFYVRAAIHQDRTPGNLLVVCHPGKLYKLPRNLLDTLTEAGFNLVRVDTDADRVKSVEQIRDALQQLAVKPEPLDLMVVSGDGSLDHHVLVAAFWAFFPDLVSYRPGQIDCSGVTEQDLAQLPETYRSAFFKELPDGLQLEPTEPLITEIWLLRSRLEGALRKRKPPEKIAKRARRPMDDLLLRISILATLLPHKVKLRPNGFDLTGLANAAQERSFQGLFPHVRSICTYPAGTAADNAVFAGVPGWGYGLFAGVLTKLGWLGPLRRWIERRVTRAFVDYFLNDSTVVPARISVVGMDGDWLRISSHAAGGPGAGHFFSADMTSKTKGMLGYLKRIPKVVIQEGLFGQTIVRIRSRFANGQEKSFTEAQMAEGLYTNRTYIAGVGSVTTTDPTSFAGQSSLCVLPPLWCHDRKGRPQVNLRGLLAFIEAIFNGTVSRLFHMLGLGVGTMAGGGKFFWLLPEYQVAIKEGESIEIDYMGKDRRPRAVNIQVSGDPFQAYRLDLRTFWGPVPLLGKRSSLLLASTRRSLANVRLQQSYRLHGVYIGGVYHFRHHSGQDWTFDFAARTGLARPRLHLPANLVNAQRLLLEAWQEAGTGEFVDTTESGLAVWRRGRYAHNNDQSAHLLMLKEPGKTLLVRQVRSGRGNDDAIYENRSYYRRLGASYIIYRSQTTVWRPEEEPRILQEDHYFRDAEAFQQEAPTFFPVVARTPQEPTLLPKEVGEGEDVDLARADEREARQDPGSDDAADTSVAP